MRRIDKTFQLSDNIINTNRGLVGVRKLLILLMAAMFLAACRGPKIHENVNDEVAKDALQLMDVVTKNVDKGILYEDANNNDKNVVDTYYNKYMGQFSTKKDLYDGVDEDILIISNATAARYMEGITLDTEKEDLKDSEQRLREFVKSGKGYSHKKEGNDEQLIEREGMAEEIIEDARYLSDVAEELLDEGVLFSSVDENDPRYVSMDSFDSNSYKNDDEEYSIEELLILGSIQNLVSDYVLQNVLDLTVDDLYERVENVRETIEDYN